MGFPPIFPSYPIAVVKTTIEVSDLLMRRVKQTALERGITLRALIEEALERTVGVETLQCPPLRTVVYGTPGGPIPANLVRLANPDENDAGYVVKRLGL